MSTPTPRTDAAWAKTFEDDEDQCRAGNAAIDMRDECATLERELTETERLRFGADADRRRLRAEVERWQTVAATMSQEREHNANEASRLRAENERLTEQLRIESAASAHALHWAEKAEAELMSLRAEVRQARKAWLGGDYDHLPLIEAMEKFRNDRENEFDAAEAECGDLKAKRLASAGRHHD